ncbi:MAG: FHA domain-containing protein [Pirellulales bacterium]|nr:FHA domain-containing protein [Pirellulales bacterium]
MRLKVLAGANSGQEVKLPAPKFFIGRAEDCHLRPKSDLISRHHCVVMVEDSLVVVRDLGSRNGTFVNDEQIVGERELRAGDKLRVGPLQFELVIVELPAAKKRPKVTSVKDAATRTANGGPGAKADDDVTQWLSEETQPEMQETREIEAGDTEEINLRTTVMLPPGDDSAETKTDSAHTAPPKPAAPPKNASNDSGKAAADVLRKFFQRR